MAENRFTRGDCVVAVGGGVVGDLAGFVASAYMRGVDFYNVPTTLLSQVDSSIGGKVAVDLGGYKNIVGAFYQPKRVLIDPELLLTLDIRQIRAGLAEALKMATTSDPLLFEMFENDEYLNDIEEIILRSLLIKRRIVEHDVHESGERRILNFGHTVGHAIESTSDLLHGECVALGMLYMCAQDVKERLFSIIDDMGLPVEREINKDALFEYILRDKKANGDNITITFVNEIGKAELRKIPIENIRDYLS
jgi:3-dehydroquinate synthase